MHIVEVVISKMSSRQTRPPVAAVTALLGCFLTLLVVYHWTSNRPQGVCLEVVTDKVHLTLPGGTLWTRPLGGHDAHSPYNGENAPDKAGAVDRIDIYQQVSDIPAKSTVMFAYRKSNCQDWYVWPRWPTPIQRVAQSPLLMPLL